MSVARIVLLGVLVLALVLGPPIVEFATGEATFNLEGIAIELAEMAMLAVTIAAVIVLMLEIRKARDDRQKLMSDLAQSRAENIKWRDSAKSQMESVRHAIERQFDLWRFTPAEKEIAGLLLKGCSHKQIAELRHSNATTVRQQAQAVYRKSGLDNRSELAAYFLDAIFQDGESDDEAEKRSVIVQLK